MGRSPCCEKVGLKKGPWTPEEDQKLLAYIEEHGHGSWRALPAKAGLQRCGKSCRLRWTNYLRPDIKRGKFTLQEEQTIIQLHALLGNRWSAIATHLPKRTDNEIKNYWNTHLKKRLAKMGIDPVTHKPKADALGALDGHAAKSAANLSHMAQWESARLEAEARLVRESKLRSTPLQLKPPAGGGGLCVEVLKGWQGGWAGKSSAGSSAASGSDLESPTSTVTFSEAVPAAGVPFSDHPAATIDFIEREEKRPEAEEDREEQHDWKASENAAAADGKGISVHMGLGLQVEEMMFQQGGAAVAPPFMEGFTELLLESSHNQSDSSSPEAAGEGEQSGASAGQDDEGKNYWKSILNLVNSSPSHSPLF